MKLFFMKLHVILSGKITKRSCMSRLRAVPPVIVYRAWKRRPRGERSYLTVPFSELGTRSQEGLLAVYCMRGGRGIEVLFLHLFTALLE